MHLKHGLSFSLVAFTHAPSCDVDKDRPQLLSRLLIHRYGKKNKLLGVERESGRGRELFEYQCVA